MHKFHVAGGREEGGEGRGEEFERGFRPKIRRTVGTAGSILNSWREPRLLRRPEASHGLHSAMVAGSGIPESRGILSRKAVSIRLYTCTACINRHRPPATKSKRSLRNFPSSGSKPSSRCTESECVYSYVYARGRFSGQSYLLRHSLNRTALSDCRPATIRSYRGHERHDGYQTSGRSGSC